MLQLLRINQPCCLRLHHLPDLNLTIPNTLVRMDGIELSGTALIISTLADDDATSNLSALKDEGDIKMNKVSTFFLALNLVLIGKIAKSKCYKTKRNLQ